VRKTKLVSGLETQHGKPLVQIVAEAYTTHQTIEAAAAALGVNPNTFAYWLVRLPIEVTTRKVATVATAA
jgi:hypothetical protein